MTHMLPLFSFFSLNQTPMSTLPSFSLLPSSPSAFLLLQIPFFFSLWLYHIGAPPTSLSICNFVHWFQLLLYTHQNRETKKGSCNGKINGGESHREKRRGERDKETREEQSSQNSLRRPSSPKDQQHTVSRGHQLPHAPPCLRRV